MSANRDLRREWPNAKSLKTIIVLVGKIYHFSSVESPCAHQDMADCPSGQRIHADEIAYFHVVAHLLTYQLLHTTNNHSFYGCMSYYTLSPVELQLREV